MDPVTLAGIVGGLVLQAIKTFGPKAGEAAASEAGKAVGEAGAGVLRRLVDKIRARFTDANDTAATEALDRLEAKPDSDARKKELEELLAEHLKTDPAFAKDLEGLVEEAKRAGLVAGGDVVQQSAVGDHNIQIARQTGGSIAINQPPQR